MAQIQVWKKIRNRQGGFLGFYLGMILFLVGCTEDVQIIDFGVEQEGGVNQGGSEGGENREGGESAGEEVRICDLDENCPSDSFCRIEENAFNGRCEEGCRLEPDSCQTPGSVRVCDPLSRRCEISCLEDRECFDEQYCDLDTNRCVEGCRLNDPTACPPLNQEARYCDELSRECMDGGVCCSEDNQCSTESKEACEDNGGEVLLGVLSCQPHPCRTRCSGDYECADNEYCSNYGRCLFGCRVGDAQSCPRDLSCDEQNHQCIALSCEEDPDCAPWQYCQREMLDNGSSSSISGQCRTGCRMGECESGICSSFRQCSSVCQEDADCTRDQDQYCDLNLNVCRSACMDAQECGRGEVCLEGRCSFGCIDDEFEELGDQTQQTAPFVEWVSSEGNRLDALESRGQLRRSRVENRILCVGDQDWIQVPLAQGERLHLRIQSRPSSGPLSVSIISPEGNLLVDSSPWNSTDRISYPYFGDEGAVEGIYAVRIQSESAIEAHPYQLLFEAAPIAQACFSDDFDPIDDQQSSAQSLGLISTLNFTETFIGSSCFGDQDYACFPMSESDGLDVNLIAPAECSPLGIRLAPSGIFNLPPNQFEGYTLQGQSQQNGETLYQLRLDAESGHFTNDEWCLHVQTDQQGQCEGYQRTLSFSRRQTVCSDLYEPNNQRPQATSIDDSGPLADGMGSLPYGVQLEMPGLLYLCTGDEDFYQITPRLEDVWRVWIVDASGPERGQSSGSLRVEFVDEQGGLIGNSAPLNPSDSEQPQKATVVSTSTDPFYLRVYGIEESYGPYQLFIQRTAGDGMCSQDIIEPDGMDGDDQLNPVSPLYEESEGYFTVNQGLLCDREPTDQYGDEDWYAFDIEQNQTRLCVKSQFIHQGGNIDIDLFETIEAGTVFCQDHEDCRQNIAESACIESQCRVPLFRAQSLTDGEMIHSSFNETRPGRYYVRVYSPEQDENRYQLQVSQVTSTSSSTSTCIPDPYEHQGGNQLPQNATILGSRRVQICDAWICQDERTQGDWFEITLPPGGDRTVHISFETQQGKLILGAQDASSPQGRRVESPRSQSRNVHCINLRGTARPAQVHLNILADLFNPFQSRIDYVLQVLPTQLDQSPRGQCDVLNEGLFENVQWPTLDLNAPFP